MLYPVFMTCPLFGMSIIWRFDSIICIHLAQFWDQGRKNSSWKILLIFLRNGTFFLAVLIKFFYILGNENPKTIPYNFSKESFPYSLENGTPLPPPKKKSLYFKRSFQNLKKQNFFVNYFIYIIHYQQEKATAKL